MKKRPFEKILPLITALEASKGQELIIQDRLSTQKGSFDRHFTSLTQLHIKLENVGIRFSGAMAYLDGDGQHIEFRTDAILDIKKTEDGWLILSSPGDSIFRQIAIQLILES